MSRRYLFFYGQHSASVLCGDLDPGESEVRVMSVLYVTQPSNSWGSAVLSFMPSSSLLLDSSRIPPDCFSLDGTSISSMYLDVHGLDVSGCFLNVTSVM